MKRQLLLLFVIFCFLKTHAQNDAMWQKVTSGSITNRITGSGNLYYKLNSDYLTARLSSVTNKTAKSIATEITIPNSNGVLEKFTVWESSNFDTELQEKYPQIRAYEGKGLDDVTARIHFSVAPIGLQTMILRSNKLTEYIEQNSDDKSIYRVFTSNNMDSKSRLECTTKDVASDKKTANTGKKASSLGVFKTLRLALSCNSEYATFYGGTKAGALAGMNATLTRVNGIFNRDLSVKLVLIAGTDAVIYTDAATDPYSNSKKGMSNDKDGKGFWNKELQSTLTKVVGEANYDMGHLFAASGGGGNAGCIGCICESPTATSLTAKGSAYTAPGNGKPQGDSFDVDYVAHEMGHQLGANHTYSYVIEDREVNVEPGSGSSIMGYAGITDYDVQRKSDSYFTYVSILQIQNNLYNRSCPVDSYPEFNPPLVNAGLNYQIPISTPFILKGNSTEDKDDAYTYTWEQNDSAKSTSGDKSYVYPTKPDGPLFRSIPPSNSLIRYMPSLNSVLENKLTSNWESVSSISRTLHFTLTVRDNKTLGQTNTGAMVVDVTSTAGPFVVTSHNIDNLAWTQGTSQTVTWDVNNTNNLQGSKKVNIKMSTDGGLTFPLILASNTANDGSEIITLPTNVPSSTNCRIMIEPTENIYYALNSKSFSVGYTSETDCNSYSFGSAFNVPYGTGFTSKVVNVPSTEEVSNVSVYVNVTHDRFSDLEMQMVSPKGTIVRLFTKSCGDVEGALSLQFDDSGKVLDCSNVNEQIVLPVEALSAFNKEDPSGNWTFRVRDIVKGNLATINSVSVNICSKNFVLGKANFETIDFTLHPNPNKGNFSVQFQSKTAEVKIFVHDILGRNVYSNTFESSGTFNQNIQLPKVSLGVYLVTVIDGDRKTVKKIVVN